MKRPAPPPLRDLIEDGLRASPDSRWPELLVELLGVMHAHFEARGLAQPAALAEAEGVVMALTQYLGGRRLYFPGLARVLTAEKRRRIAAEMHAGKPWADVSKRYGMSKAAVYEIAAHCQPPTKPPPAPCAAERRRG